MDQENRAESAVADGSAKLTTIAVELRYTQRKRSRRVELRSADTLQTLWVSVVADGPAALHAAARALAVCESRRWTIAKIEPFPWADEFARASANDAPTREQSSARRRGASRAQ